MPEHLVLMLNDTAIGIYTTHDKADEAADVHRLAHPVAEYQTQYYYTRSFIIDAPAS